MDRSLRTGDVVKFKHNSQRATVERVHPNGEIDVVWFTMAVGGWDGPHRARVPVCAVEGA